MSFTRIHGGAWLQWRCKLSESIYKLDSCFDRRALDTVEGRRKARLFAALVPAACRTILDAGGGTGWTTIELRNRCNVVTLDSSAESLRHAPGATRLASVDALPYTDHSFDMVISSQVLEHLPSDVLARTLSEMMRVAKDYLLVSVPYREALNAKFMRCTFCQHAFHPDYHVRTFTEEDLVRLFPQWIMAEWHVFGPLNAYAGVRNDLRARATNICPLPAAPSTTLCPRCGKRGDGSGPRLVDGKEPIRWSARAFNRIRRQLSLANNEAYAKVIPQERVPYWITALFVRTANTALIDADLNTPLRSNDNINPKIAT